MGPGPTLCFSSRLLDPLLHPRKLPLPSPHLHLLPANPSCRFHRLTAPVPATADPLNGSQPPNPSRDGGTQTSLLLPVLPLSSLPGCPPDSLGLGMPNIPASHLLPLCPTPALSLECVWTHLPASTSVALGLQPRLQIHALLQGWVEAWGPPKNSAGLKALGAGACRARGVGRGGEGYASCAN